MKQSTIKHIALGLFLAGYATSSAWALGTTSSTAIQGHKPILRGVKDNAKDHTITIRTKKQDTDTTHGKGERLRVGDRIILTYKLTDADGDKDSDKDSTLTSVQFYYRFYNDNTWHKFNDSSILKREAPKEANGISTIEVRVPRSAEKAVAIGYKIQEKTQYGYPDGGQWYKVPNALALTPEDLGTGTPTDPGDNIGKPTDPDAGGGGDIDTEVEIKDCDPVTEPDECGILPGKGERGAIYAVINGVADTSVDFVTTTDKYPVVSGTYIVQIYNKDDKDITSEYDKFQWVLKGNNSEAVKPLPGVDANNYAIAGATSQQYKIGDNAQFKDFIAGAQGFKLHVDSTSTTKSIH